MRKWTTAVPLVVALAAIFMVAGCSKKTAQKPITPAPVESAEPKPVTPEAPESAVVPVETGLADVFFDYDKSNLRPDAIQVLFRNAEHLKGHPEVRILIEGHCDERGTIEYNLALGDRRARSARDFLVNYGIAAGRIETISYGKERPFATGQDEGAWSQNRRAHFAAR